MPFNYSILSLLIKIKLSNLNKANFCLSWKTATTIRLNCWLSILKSKKVREHTSDVLDRLILIPSDSH